MRIQKSSVHYWIILFILFCAPICNAQDIPMATGEWAPFTSAHLEGYGEFTRRVTIVFQEMGVEPDYHFYPWRRCFDSVIKGGVWAAFPYAYTKERANRVLFSDMLSCSRTVFFYYDRGEFSKQYHFNSLQDLEKYRLGGVIGYFYEELFNDAGLSVDYVNKEVYALEKLKLGRVDLIPMNERVGWGLIKSTFHDDINKFRILEKPLSVNPLHLIVSKDYPGSMEFLVEFNEALKKCIDKKIINIDKCK